MAHEFVLFLKGVFFFSLNWLFMNVFATPSLMISSLIIENKTAAAIYYHGSIQIYNRSKESILQVKTKISL